MSGKGEGPLTRLPATVTPSLGSHKSPPPQKNGFLPATSAVALARKQGGGARAKGGDSCSRSLSVAILPAAPKLEEAVCSPAPFVRMAALYGADGHAGFLGRCGPGASVLFSSELGLEMLRIKRAIAC